MDFEVVRHCGEKQGGAQKKMVAISAESGTRAGLGPLRPISQHLIPPARFYFRGVLSKTAPPTGDQVVTHISLSILKPQEHCTLKPQEHVCITKK